MKKLILTIPVAAALALGGATASIAAVNCGIINKDLERGRAPEDIAERMGVAVAEVKECKAKGPNATTGSPEAKGTPDTSPKGAEPPATQSKSKQ